MARKGSKEPAAVLGINREASPRLWEHRPGEQRHPQASCKGQAPPTWPRQLRGERKQKLIWPGGSLTPSPLSSVPRANRCPPGSCPTPAETTSTVPGGKMRRCSLPTGGAQHPTEETLHRQEPVAQGQASSPTQPLTRAVTLRNIQKRRRPWCPTPVPACVGAEDVCREVLILGLRSMADSHSSSQARQEWTPAHHPEGCRHGWGSQQITTFLTALPCQCLPAERTVHLEHREPRDCCHKQEAHLDSRPLPFSLEGFQQDNSSELEKNTKRARNTCRAL